MNFQHNITLPT